MITHHDKTPEEKYDKNIDNNMIKILIKILINIMIKHLDNKLYASQNASDMYQNVAGVFNNAATNNKKIKK